MKWRQDCLILRKNILLTATQNLTSVYKRLKTDEKSFIRLRQTSLLTSLYIYWIFNNDQWRNSLQIQNENHQTIAINVPSSVPFSLTVPEEMDGREGTVRDFAARCSGIIMEAIKWAPETTRSLLQVGRMHTVKPLQKNLLSLKRSHPRPPSRHFSVEFQLCIKLVKFKTFSG